MRTGRSKRAQFNGRGVSETGAHSGLPEPLVRARLQPLESLPHVRCCEQTPWTRGGGSGQLLNRCVQRGPLRGDRRYSLMSLGERVPLCQLWAVQNRGSCDGETGRKRTHVCTYAHTDKQVLPQGHLGHLRTALEQQAAQSAAQGHSGCGREAPRRPAGATQNPLGPPGRNAPSPLCPPAAPRVAPV